MTATTSQPLAGIAIDRQPVTIEWHWAYSFWPVYIWLFLLLLLLIKANRSLKAASVVVAAAASLSVACVAGLILPISAANSAFFVYAVTAAMLMSYRSQGQDDIRKLMWLAAFFAITVDTWPFFGSGMFKEFGEAFFSFVFHMFFLYLGLAVARRMCRGGYSMWRLLLSLALWPFALLMLGYVVTMAFMFSDGIDLITPVYGMGSVLVFALYLPLLLLPFILLGTYNPLYRERVAVQLQYVRPLLKPGQSMLL